MNQKISELEDIFKMILKSPVVKKTDTTAMDPLSFTTNNEIIQVNNIQDSNSKIIEENMNYLKAIQQLKEHVINLENTLESQKAEIYYLNNINYELKKQGKTLKDSLLKLKGSIRVSCRIRPNNNENSKFNLKYDDRNIYIDDKVYSLDHIYDIKSNQMDIYEEIKPEIESVMEGYNICIFAYGQTGSGKTYTMEGVDKREGLMFQALQEFQSISHSLKLQGYSCNFTVKYLEVYNESIQDLLTGSEVTIFHDSNGIILKNCSSLEYDNSKKIEDAYKILKNTLMKRKKGETNCNLTSSRSHALLIVNVVVDGNNETRKGSLCLIDLAGSERLNESKAENERLKETQFINKSLSALGNVIVALKRKENHIPFRDSKLTHLMQGYFTGNSRTSMIVHINPENINESICSLRFATKVSECSMKVAGRDVTKHL